MRSSLVSTLFILLLASCGPATEPTAEPATTTEPAPPPVTPTDEQVTGDPVIDYARKQQGIIDELFTTGMLQQKNITYVCDGIRGTAEVHKNGDQVVLVRNRYNDGEDRTITDRFYYVDDELVHQFSETLRWEFDGATKTDQNGTEVPVINNYVSRYRYYIREGKVLKFLKRKFNFTSPAATPVEENYPLEEMTPASELSYRTELARMAIEDGVVDCEIFK